MDGFVFVMFFCFSPEASSPPSGLPGRAKEGMRRGKRGNKKGGGSMGLFAACVLCCNDAMHCPVLEYRYRY